MAYLLYLVLLWAAIAGVLSWPIIFLPLARPLALREGAPNLARLRLPSGGYSGIAPRFPVVVQTPCGSYSTGSVSMSALAAPVVPRTSSNAEAPAMDYCPMEKVGVEPTSGWLAPPSKPCFPDGAYETRTHPKRLRFTP